MKLIILVIFCIASFLSTNCLADPTLPERASPGRAGDDEYGIKEFPSMRGADYNLEKSVLTITKTSLKLIDRFNKGEHATKLLKGGFPVLSVKFALENLYNSHNLVTNNEVGISLRENLLIEFEGEISNLMINHICRGKYGNYLSLSVPDIFFTTNFIINTIDGEKNIKNLIIRTDPSTGLLLQKELFRGTISNYWRFFLKRMDYDKKFKVQGLINFAEQDLVENEIESLVITIVI
ncbi:hypothetical protein KJ671_02325, partial [Patescibacteria group bacterium]|nr:hypothetical protein [Patescibacteria group bacterium]